MKKLFALLLALIMVLSLVACGGDTSTDDTTDDTATTEKIGEGRTLVVGIWGDVQEALVREHVIPAFEEETGATVELILGGSSDRYAKLYAEVDAPSMDVMYLNMTQTEQATADDMILPVDPEVVTNYETLYDLAKCGNGYGVAFNAIGLMYHTDVFEEAPTSWSVMWEEEYAGKVAPYVFPGTQGTAFLVMAAKTFGGDENNIDPGFEAIAQLKPFPMIGDGIPELNQAFLDGTVVLAPQTDGYVYAAKDEGLPVDFVIPEEGAVLGMNCAVIPKNTQNADLAKIWINYHLDQACQQGYAEDLYYGPTNSAVVLDDELAAKVIYGEEEVAGLYALQNSVVSANQDAWAERWNTEILG